MKRAINYTGMPEQSELVKRSKQHLQNRQGHAITISSSIDPQFSSTTSYPGLVGMHPSIMSDNLIDTPACAPFVRSVVVAHDTLFPTGTILCLKQNADRAASHFNVDVIYDFKLVEDMKSETVTDYTRCVVVEPGSLIEGKYNSVSVSFADCTDILIKNLGNGAEIGKEMKPGEQYAVMRDNTIVSLKSGINKDYVILLFTVIYHNRVSGLCTACLHEPVY